MLLITLGIMVSSLSLSTTEADSPLSYVVAPNGNDLNPGTKERPFATLTRARNAVRERKEKQVFPAEGFTVWIKGGIYSFDETLRLTAQDSGTENGPITYRTAKGEEAVFDGSRLIDVSGFARVEDDATLRRLNPSARGRVHMTTINDDDRRSALQKSSTRLSFNGTMMRLARFPNVGFAHLGKIVDKGAVYAHGRTFGDPPAHSQEDPIGGVFTLVETPGGDWEEEFKRIQKATVTGYLAYDWYRENHKIAGIKDGNIQLQEYSRYGIHNYEKIPRRLIVLNLLCELDEPGEWFFDDEANTLFLWPFSEINQDTQLGIWAGPAFVVIDGASHVTFQDLTVQCTTSGDGLFVVKNGEANKIAGCTLRNSTRTAVYIDGGRKNGMIGCDVYDVGGHLHLDGGETETLTHGENYAVNCHFTQVQGTDFYGRIAVRGVGNVFRNNLVHNAMGQIMTLGGNDHLVERNEMFHIGFEEGDGGTIYSGAAMWSYGNVYRHNFLHHLMCLPQAHPRGGIYPDDHDAGDTIVENVFYKAAHRAVLLNNGAGHTVARNIFIRGHIGIYNTCAYAERNYAAIAKFDSGELKRGDKGDHIWRTEQVVGKEGWNHPPWSTRYPVFQRVMNQEKMRFYPIECHLVENLFCENQENIQFRTGWGKDSLVDIATMEYIETRDNREISMDLFVDLEVLDFRLKDPVAAPAIPFEKIGLYVDEYRPSVPDKKAYRNAVRDRFSSRPSFDPDATYDPETINDLIYFNTGKLLFEGEG